jgi:xanthine dehydrogenase FAD-binding subunit
MNFWKHYHLAISIEDALEAMSATDGPVCPIAGGTDLLLELQQSHHSPVDTLVDINRIPELGCLEMRGEQVYIGAVVPVSEIVRSAMIQKYAAAEIGRAHV